MSDPIELDLGDEAEHVVEPPIIDHLHLDEPRGMYVVTLIPQDDVSPNEKEIVEIPLASEDGRRITLRLSELAKLVGGNITRLYHSGGGNFGFKLESRSIELSELPHPWLAAYVHLQDLGMIAQIAFRDVQLSRTPAA